MKSNRVWIWKSSRAVKVSGNRFRYAPTAIAIAALLALAACGDGVSSSAPNMDTRGGGDRPLKGTHTIGGSITGLIASGLVLLDNGADNLRVAKDATKFTFATPLAAGSAYAVSIGNHPFGQYCSVGSQSGVAAVDITSVAVSCGNWDAAHALVSTVAGSTTAGNVDGAAADARFSSPTGVAIDANGNLYVADNVNNQIRKITPAGVVSTLAGNGTAGHADGVGVAASFDNPMCVAVDAVGNVYVADTNNNEIRKITPSGVVSTLAGNTTAGNADGAGAAASFDDPVSVAVDVNGNVYVADYSNNAIRKITPAGVVSTFAGSGTAGNVNGIGAAASFNSPFSVDVDADGNVYVSDAANHSIRKITSAGVVSTIAIATTGGVVGVAGAAVAVKVDAAGNLYLINHEVVGSTRNEEILMLTPTDAMAITLAGGKTVGHADGLGADASFGGPAALAIDASGNLYVADAGNNTIRKITRTP